MGTEPEGRFCWPQGDAAPIRQAVDTAEKFADGRASEAELRTCFDRCRALADQAQSIAGSANYTLGDHYSGIELLNSRQTAASYLAAMFTCAPTMAQALPQHRYDLGVVLFRPLEQSVEGVRQAVRAAGMATFNPGGQSYPDRGAYGDAGERARQDEGIAQGGLFRHIMGNPFRPYPAPPSWPSTVVQLAESLYAGQDCAFALHDALLEAGHAELAEHFREEKSHPKGCWAMDVILGKA
jgi:hypothetical protein